MARERGETSGPIIATAALTFFAAAVVAVKAGVLDALIAAAMPLLGAVAALGLAVFVVAASPRRGVHRIHIRPARDHGHGHDPIRHEALGHAAVGAGVTGTTRGIRARVYPDGSGWCDVPRAPLTLAQSIAITRAGEYAAGPSGCGPDRERARRELRRVPRRERAAVSAEADRLVRQHAGSAFGRQVARSLARTGRFR